jgi:hypothetical protein
MQEVTQFTALRVAPGGDPGRRVAPQTLRPPEEYAVQLASMCLVPAPSWVAGVRATRCHLVADLGP